jgi:hypothetical protein
VYKAVLSYLTDNMLKLQTDRWINRVRASVWRPKNYSE